MVHRMYRQVDLGLIARLEPRRARKILLQAYQTRGTIDAAAAALGLSKSSFLRYAARTGAQDDIRAIHGRSSEATPDAGRPTAPVIAPVAQGEAPTWGQIYDAVQASRGDVDAAARALGISTAEFFDACQTEGVDLALIPTD